MSLEPHRHFIDKAFVSEGTTRAGTFVEAQVWIGCGGFRVLRREYRPIDHLAPVGAA